MQVFENEGLIKDIIPSFEKIAKLKCRSVIVTTKGDHVDFVSRFFTPQSSINGDPVTGSTHTTATGVTSTSRSMRSNNGQEILFKYFCTVPGGQVRSFSA